MEVTVVILGYDKNTYKVRYDGGIYTVNKSAVYNITNLGTMIYANCNTDNLTLYIELED